VAVGNAVRSYLEGKTGTIATLKCLGAPGRLVFQVYLVQVMALALVAVAAGLAIGAAAPYLVGAILGDRLGWRAVGAIYPLPLLVAAVFGLLTTLAFSLWPLAHARGVPAASLFRDLVAPLRAPVGRATWAAIALSGLLLAGLAIATATDRRLALYFVAGTVGALVLFRATGLGIMALARRARRPRDPGLRLAIANLHRPGAPTGSVVMSLGLGLTVLVAIALIEGNLGRQIERNLPEQAPGFYFIDIQPDQVTASPSCAACPCCAAASRRSTAGPARTSRSRPRSSGCSAATGASPGRATRSRGSSSPPAHGGRRTTPARPWSRSMPRSASCLAWGPGTV
jgi:putative ABC transport system permease protein